MADAQAVRERLAGDGHAEVEPERAAGAGGEHLLRHGRGGGQVAQGRAPGAATAERVLVTGCAANLPARALAGVAANATVLPARAELVPAAASELGGVARLRRRRRARLRAHARIREGAGRLLVRMQLLRHPRRCAARAAAAPRPPCSPRSRRRAAQGHREVVLTGINLGCFRDRAAGMRLADLIVAAAERGRDRARAPVVDRGQPPDRRAARRARATPRRRPPARAHAVGRRRRAAGDAPPLTPPSGSWPGCTGRGSGWRA